MTGCFSGTLSLPRTYTVVQKMRIVWNCIGEFMPPQPKKDEKTA